MLFANAAEAHEFIPGVTGFPALMLHPIFLTQQLLGIVTAGLAAGRARPFAALPFLVSFGLGLAAGQWLATTFPALVLLHLWTATHLVILAASVTVAAFGQLPRTVAVILVALLAVIIGADIQPAWLYLDTRTLSKQFSLERMRYFQPLRSLFEAGVTVGGGSDHMQKIGSLRSVNPYNPFLGMWIAITRNALDFEGALHPQESLSRLQAIRFYTINNARLLFLEKETGSLEPGKAADFIVLDRNILECPVDEIKDARVKRTYLSGDMVYSADL